jgi:hypothetical protein
LGKQRCINSVLPATRRGVLCRWRILQNCSPPLTAPESYLVEQVVFHVKQLLPTTNHIEVISGRDKTDRTTKKSEFLVDVGAHLTNRSEESRDTRHERIRRRSFSRSGHRSGVLSLPVNRLDLIETTRATRGQNHTHGSTSGAINSRTHHSCARDDDAPTCAASRFVPRARRSSVFRGTSIRTRRRRWHRRRVG